MVLSPLRPYTTYCYALVLRDSTGNLARSEVFQFTTRDSIPPAPPVDLQAAVARTDSVTFSWQPATDTFDGAGAPRRSGFPNYRIARYVVRIGNQGIDSTNLDPADSALYSTFLSSEPSTSRFSWSGGRWNWYWRDFRPGASGKVRILAYDVSGNPSTVAEVVYSVPQDSTLAAGCGSGWVPVSGTSQGLSSFCIEEREHSVSGRPVARVTWSQAIDACTAIGAELCSEAQWVRSCESFPDTASGTLPYGAIGAGEFASDTTQWLQANCQLGTGDSVAMLDSSRSDSRCVSGWGVRDLPGRLGEWTRDVYTSSSPASGNIESGTLAYTGPSDITGAADLGTLHGGSALVLDQVDRTLSTARCRTRNYPAGSTIDTLRDGAGNYLGVRQHPLPSGISSAWGFRCCKLLWP